MLANLKALRTAQGLSQRALADFVKVSQQSINQYENRDTEPDIAVLTRIADYFGVSIDYLVGHDPAAGELIPTNLQMQNSASSSTSASWMMTSSAR